MTMPSPFRLHVRLHIIYVFIGTEIPSLIAGAGSPAPSSGPRQRRELRTSLFKKVFTLLPEALVPKYLKSRNTPLPLLSPSAASFARSQSIPELPRPEPPIRPPLSRTPSISNEAPSSVHRGSSPMSSRRRVVSSQ